MADVDPEQQPAALELFLQPFGVVAVDQASKQGADGSAAPILLFRSPPPLALLNIRMGSTEAITAWAPPRPGPLTPLRRALARSQRESQIRSNHVFGQQKETID